MSSVQTKKNVFLILLLPILFFLFTSKAYAHDAYYLQTRIDTTNYLYMHKVKFEKGGTFSGEKKHHEEFQIGKGNLYLGDGEYGKGLFAVPTKKDDYQKKVDTTIGDYPGTFLFRPSGFSGNDMGDASNLDQERAKLIGGQLTNSLNEAILFVNDGEKPKNIDELIKITNGITKAVKDNGTYNGYSFKRNIKMSTDQSKKDNPNMISGYDYVTISKGKESKQLLYRMKKGYVSKCKVYKKGSTTECKSKELKNKMYDEIAVKGLAQSDTTYLSWSHLAYQANAAYFVEDLTGANSDVLEDKSNWLTEIIVGFLQDILNQVEALLGLEPADDLIFNQGIRGSDDFVYGVFPAGWMKIITVMHWLFQAIAWSLVTLALTKMLIQRNIATVNPFIRASLMEDIKDLLLAGFLLASIWPFMQMFLFLNEGLVKMFASFSSSMGLSSITDVSNLNVGTIGGVIISFFFFFFDIFINVIYIFRSILIAILIVIGPLFIISLAFGERFKQMFGTWMQEFISNVFIQSFHAFLFSFYILIIGATSGATIIKLVLLYSLLPFTELFRSMILGGQSSGVGSMIGANGIARLSGSLPNMKSDKNQQKGNRSLKGENSEGKEGVGSSQETSSVGGSYGGGTSTNNAPTVTTGGGSGNVGGTNGTDNKSENVNSSNGYGSKMKEGLGKVTSIGNKVGEVGKGTTAKAINSQGGKVGSAMGSVGAKAAGLGLGLALGGIAASGIEAGSRIGKAGGNTRKDAQDWARRQSNQEGNNQDSLEGNENKTNPNVEVPEQDNGNFLESSIPPVTSQGRETETYSPEMLHSIGINQMTSYGDGVQISYDRNSGNMSQADKRNLAKIETLWKNGDRESLKRQGIEGVSYNGNATQIHYNKKGMKKLNMGDIRKKGNMMTNTKREGSGKTQITFNV